MESLCGSYPTVRIGVFMNEQENLALQSGFTGEKKRDASASIRGFVYQNLLAVEELIQEKTDRVFCEYVEDVTSVDREGNCSIIQAKYYASTLPSSMEKEVFREMYCQYLKLQAAGKLNRIIPTLNVFSPEKKISVPEWETAVEWVNDNPKPTVISSLDELNTRKLDKEEREAAIMNLCGSTEKLQQYYQAYKIVQNPDDLDVMRQKLGADLVRLFEEQLEDSALDALGSVEQGTLLLGVAYLMILETFDRMKKPAKKGEEDARILEHKEIRRSDFLAHLTRHIEERDEAIIRKTVQAMVTEVFFSVLAANPDMESRQVLILEEIVKQTVDWMGELLSGSAGQCAFYNTVSFAVHSTAAEFAGWKVKKRQKEILKCFSGIRTFLKYLWKIMMNICLEKVDFDPERDAKLLDPRHYVVEDQKEYICFRFAKDFVKSSVILPSVNSDEGRQERKQVYSRMYLVRPEKWFMGGDPGRFGRYDYKYSPSEIREDLQPVSSIWEEDEVFYLECMDCIGIDAGDWKKTEVCTDCIFSRKCLKGKL